MDFDGVEITILSIMAVAAIFALVGFIATTKIQNTGKRLKEIWADSIYKDENGFIPPECQTFFKEHPAAKACYDIVRHNGKNAKQVTEELMSCGADCVIRALFDNRVVITPEMLMIHYHDLGETFIVPYPNYKIAREFFRAAPRKEVIGSYTTQVKPEKKSVIGNAVAGAVIAGGAGAVVGAIHAASKNADATPITKIEYLCRTSPSGVIVNPYGDSTCDTMNGIKRGNYVIELNHADFSFSKKLKHIAKQDEIDRIWMGRAVEIAWGVSYDDEPLQKQNPEVYASYTAKRAKAAEKIAAELIKLKIIEPGQQVETDFESARFFADKLVGRGAYFCEDDVWAALHLLEKAQKAEGNKGN